MFFNVTQKKSKKILDIGGGCGLFGGLGGLRSQKENGFHYPSGVGYG